MRFLLALLAGFAFVGPAEAAPQSAPCIQSTQTSTECDPVNTQNPLPTQIVNQPWAPVTVTVTPNTLPAPCPPNPISKKVPPLC